MSTETLHETYSPPASADQTPPASATELLAIENGDRLTRAEFERRYRAMPYIKKAELIEGVVHVGSPVHFASHAEPHADIIGWLSFYRMMTSGVRLADNATVRLDADNEVQPDALLRIDPSVGGRSVVTSDDYIQGAPELAVEIAASTASYDLHDKRNVYRRCGVQEYLVWRVYDKQLDWWHLREGVYRPLAANESGVVASVVLPGLWLAVPALLAGDMPTVVATLQQGLQTTEHAAFAQRLKQSTEGT